jgi:hypothetical protein
MHRGLEDETPAEAKVMNYSLNCSCGRQVNGDSSAQLSFPRASTATCRMSSVSG